MTTPPPLTPAKAGAQAHDGQQVDTPAPGVGASSPGAEPLDPGLRRGERNSWRGAKLAYSLALAVLVVDQASKVWVLEGLRLPFKGQIPVFPPVFNLTFVWNQGVSFGLLRGQADVARWGLVVFSAVVVAALALWARRVDRPLTAAAVGLIMGGAVGNNLIDRVRFGAVVDFLDFAGLRFPWVFNVADSAISVGVALLLLDSFLQPKPAKA